MHYSQLLSFALSLRAAQAAYQGFNYGSTHTDGSAKDYSTFKNEFTTAQNLVGTSGFNSARLYTMIQAGTTNTVISAIPAAVDTDTSVLLGLWCSGDTFDNELTALKTAIQQFPDLKIAGISIGSEDLYRNSPTGIEAKAGLGQQPDVLVSYIKKVKAAISGTSWSGAKIGHVDTWTAWTNGSNSEVVAELDWLGVDAYPYFQSTMSNAVSSGSALISDALTQTEAYAQGKEIWITETGWPVSGDTQNLAVASLSNAKTYWDDVGCPRFGKTNIWWYLLQDALPTAPSPSFGLVGSTLTTTPLFNLTCPAVSESASTSSGSSSSTKTGSSSGSKTSGSSSATATGSHASITSSGSSASATGSASSSVVFYNSTSVGTVSGHATTFVVSATSTVADSASTGAAATGSSTASSASSTVSFLASSGASSVEGSVISILGVIVAAIALF